MEIGKNAGLSYIELLVAMALVIIIAAPIISALTVAQANHRYAKTRLVAQGYANALVLEVRAEPDNAAAITAEMSARDGGFTYRVILSQIGGSSRNYVSPLAAEADIPPPTGISFQSEFSSLYGNGIFVVAEVFDGNGLLAGMSVGKIN